MKRLYIFMLLLTAFYGYSQQKSIPGDLTLAVKQTQGWSAYKPFTPDFSYYNRNYDSVLSKNSYTSNILESNPGSIYVDGDKLYSNQYIPIVLQQQQSNLKVDNYYRYEKMYAQPDPVNTQVERK